jgi:hypothetical protein
VLPPAHVTYIASPSNAYVKHAAKLVTSRTYRETTGSVLLAGGRLLSEVARDVSLGGTQQLHARVLLLADGMAVPDGVTADRVLGASTEVLRKVRQSC